MKFIRTTMKTIRWSVGTLLVLGLQAGTASALDVTQEIALSLASASAAAPHATVTDKRRSGTEGENTIEGLDDNGGSEAEIEVEVEGSMDSATEGSVDSGTEGSDNSGTEGSVDSGTEGSVDDNGGGSEGETHQGGEGQTEGQAVDPASDIELQFTLKGTANDPAATGEAELRNDNGRRRIEAQVQGLTAAGRISVLVDGVNVGTARVSGGEAEVKRDERDNYTIPAVTGASRIDVIDSETGIILLSNLDVAVPEGQVEGSVEGSPATEGEVIPPATDGIVLSQKLGANGTYVPGENTVIEARMSYTGTGPILALSIEETLPAGWTYVGTVDDMGAFLKPQPGDSGTLTWAWIVVPQMPAVLHFEVTVPADATGVQTINGNVLYRRMGGAEYAVSNLDAPAGLGFTKDFCHTTDSNKDWTIELSEVLRTIQVFNVGTYHCSGGTEDGYAPGAGPQDCTVQDADQLNPDWSLELGELVRIIQFYNAEDSAYIVQDGTEDGFKPGVFSLDN